MPPSEASLLYDLARVEAAVIPERILVDRIEFEPAPVVSLGDKLSLRLDIGWTSLDIADAFRHAWGVTIDEGILRREEVAPQETNVAVRWRELHRGIGSTSRRLEQVDPGAHLTHLALDVDAENALVTARFRDTSVTIVVPLGEPRDYCWDAVEMLLEAGLNATDPSRSGRSLPAWSSFYADSPSAQQFLAGDPPG